MTGTLSSLQLKEITAWCASKAFKKRVRKLQDRMHRGASFNLGQIAKDLKVPVEIVASQLTRANGSYVPSNPDMVVVWQPEGVRLQ